MGHPLDRFTFFVRSTGRNMSTPYQPIKMRRTFEVIIDLLKEKIFSDEYQPGDRLPSERELSQMIEVSRSAVREAYHALEILDIVEVRRGTEGGTFIKEPTHRPLTQSISDLMRLRKISLSEMTETRRLLEKDLVGLAIERITEKDFVELQGWVDRAFEKINRGVAAHEENVRFHLRLSEASGNRLLSMVYSSVMDLFLLILQTLPANLESSHIIAKEHGQIISLLKNRDLDQLLTLLDRHIKGSNQRLIVQSDKNSFFKSLFWGEQGSDVQNNQPIV
jgi:GntR family transcriptional regulator, transcriptional repressor for pyruvate dehydrogenase complex